MARFQVFIPHTEDQRLDDMQPANPLTRVGLTDIIGGSSAQPVIGPEEQKGVLISWTGPGDTITGYRPEEQTWIPAVPRDELEAKRYWVGIWNDRRPTQKDLKRPYPYRGKPVVLNDGAEWLIPAARELPNEMILADDGSYKFEVQRKYHEFWTESDKWLTKLANASGEDTFKWNELSLFIESALKLNYIITPEVIGELRIFSQENIFKALYAVCGVELGG
ncbi:hypothetical protein [Gimesia maris]|uniref:hypothetical protein n=1 Tax=Gimesia maris TaxID=122 RepID=UPI0032EAEB10